MIMTVKGIQTCTQLTWQQSNYDFLRYVSSSLTEKQQEEGEDLIQIFLRAIEIYKGRVKGYLGLVDNAYLRENFLRAELKLLIKEVIQEVIRDIVKNNYDIVPVGRATVDLREAQQAIENKR